MSEGRRGREKGVWEGERWSGVGGRDREKGSDRGSSIILPNLQVF